MVDSRRQRTPHPNAERQPIQARLVRHELLRFGGDDSARALERGMARKPRSGAARRCGGPRISPADRALACYGGSTDRHGTSFETLSWASALLAATKDIVAFATVHVPLVNPVFAAKSCVTADHVGQGRFGLNVVSGWNVEEFQSFGRAAARA